MICNWFLMILCLFCAFEWHSGNVDTLAIRPRLHLATPPFGHSSHSATLTIRRSCERRRIKEYQRRESECELSAVRALMTRPSGLTVSFDSTRRCGKRKRNIAWGQTDIRFEIYVKFPIRINVRNWFSMDLLWFHTYCTFWNDALAIWTLQPFWTWRYGVAHDEWWMMNERWMMNDERGMMNDKRWKMKYDGWTVNDEF